MKKDNHVFDQFKLKQQIAQIKFNEINEASYDGAKSNAAKIDEAGIYQQAKASNNRIWLTMKKMIGLLVVLTSLSPCAMGQTKQTQKHYYYYISAMTTSGQTLSCMTDITHEATEQICKIVITNNQ